MLRFNPFRSVRASIATLATATTMVVVIGGGGAASASSARATFQPRPVVAGSDYLALGDSVAFGYREPANLPTPTYSDAASFVGYPEDVAAALGLKVANAACPGETSASLIDPYAVSNGCEDSPTSSAGYRTAYPLHVRYAGTQLAYAVHFLRSHPDTRLVTLMIGANDGFICQATTKDGCASELPSVLKAIAAHVRTILSTVRQKAHYRGRIVIVDYYSLDYSNATSSGFSQALNVTQNSAARPFHVAIADGYGAFAHAAAQVGGNSCTAGLLTTLTTGGCGVHPSVAGQALLAQTVAASVH